MLDHWLLLVFASWKLPKFHNENIPPGLARVARRKTARFAPTQHQLLIALRSSKRGRKVTNNIKHVFHLMKEWKAERRARKKFTQNFVLISLSHITSFSFSFIFLFSPMPLTCCWCSLLCRIIWFRVFPLLFHPKEILIKESFPIFMLKLILLLYPLSDAIFSPFLHSLDLKIYLWRNECLALLDYANVKSSTNPFTPSYFLMTTKLVENM